MSRWSRRRCSTTADSSGWPKTSGSRGLHILVRIAPAVGLPRRAARGRDPRARGREPRAGPRDRPVVEGGARRERVRRLQPERQGPHRRVGVLRAGAARCAGLDPAQLGRGARVAGPRSSRCARSRRGSPSAAIRTPGIDDAVGTLDGLLALAEGARPRREAAARRRRHGPARLDDAAHRGRPHEDEARGARRRSSSGRRSIPPSPSSCTPPT